MPTLRGKHFFIVEDNALNRVVYQMTLVPQGVLIDFERWGKDSLVALKLCPVVDLIILDLMLHNNVSGFDIFAQIRAIPQYDPVPIVAVSAAEPSIAIPRAKELGFSGYISKPIDEALFPDQISRILAGEQIWHDGTLTR